MCYYQEICVYILKIYRHVVLEEEIKKVEGQDAAGSKSQQQVAVCEEGGALKREPKTDAEPGELSLRQEEESQVKFVLGVLRSLYCRHTINPLRGSQIGHALSACYQQPACVLNFKRENPKINEVYLGYIKYIAKQGGGEFNVVLSPLLKLTILVDTCVFYVEKCFKVIHREESLVKVKYFGALFAGYGEFLKKDLCSSVEIEGGLRGHCQFVGASYYVSIVGNYPPELDDEKRSCVWVIMQLLSNLLMESESTTSERNGSFYSKEIIKVLKKYFEDEGFVSVKPKILEEIDRHLEDPFWQVQVPPLLALKNLFTTFEFNLNGKI